MTRNEFVEQLNKNGITPNWYIRCTDITVFDYSKDSYDFHVDDDMVILEKGDVVFVVPVEQVDCVDIQDDRMLLFFGLGSISFDL